MKIKLGPDDGNSGAVIRWGKCLDNGLWLRRKLWSKWKLQRGYISIGFAVFRWSN